MTAQIANGGYSIKPKIIVNNNPLNFIEAKKVYGRTKFFLILIISFLKKKEI